MPIMTVKMITAMDISFQIYLVKLEEERKCTISGTVIELLEKKSDILHYTNVYERGDQIVR